jgi:hypothetical protein
MSTWEDFLKLIEQARSRNNILWMDILKIALENAPDETQIVLRQITENDDEIADLIAGIAGENIKPKHRT